MTAPVRVTVTYDDVRGLAGFELYRALRLAGLRRVELEAATAALQDDAGDVELAYRGILFLQAVALELALREDRQPPPTWDDAQRWDVRGAEVDVADPLAEDERRYRANAAVVTGLPPDDAMRVAVGDVAEIARARGLGG